MNLEKILEFLKDLKKEEYYPYLKLFSDFSGAVNEGIGEEEREIIIFNSEKELEEEIKKWYKEN